MYPAFKATTVIDGVAETFVHTNKDEARNVFWLKSQEVDELTFILEPIQVEEVTS